MFLFCPLINTWSYFRKNRVAWPGGRDKAVRKNICSSISLYIIRHQKIVWWGSHLKKSLKPTACYFSVCMAYFKQHSCVSTEFHMLWGLSSQRRCDNKQPIILCNDVTVNISQSAFQMGKKPQFVAFAHFYAVNSSSMPISSYQLFKNWPIESLKLNSQLSQADLSQLWHTIAHVCDLDSIIRDICMKQASKKEREIWGSKSHID